MRRRAAAALPLVPLVVALGVVVAGGGLTIPHNDSWAYSRIAERFAAEGTVELVGWNRPGLIGQTLLAVPLTRLLPDALVAQHLTVWCLAVLLAVATERFFRPALGLAGARLAASVTALFPGLGLLATSFMADVPSAALGMLCLLAGARAAAALPRPVGWAWLAWSLVIGWLGATTREQALAAPAAVLLWLGWRLARTGRWRELAGLVGAAGAFLGAFTAVELWRRGLANADAPLPIAASWRSLADLARGAVTLGVALLPVSVFLAPGLRGTRVGPRGAAALAVAVAGLVLLLVRAAVGGEPLLPGNYLGGAVPYPEAGLGAPPAVLPAALWVVAAGAGGLSLLVVLVLLGRAGGHASHHPRLGLAVTFVALTLAGTALQTLAGQPLFDRYLLPLVGVVAGLCLAAAPRRRSTAAVPAVAAVPAATGSPERLWGAAAATAAGLLGVVGLVLVATGTAHDVARWQAAERLVAEGAAPRDVAAGLEWVGWHSATPFRPTAAGPARTAWSVNFADSRDCWVVAGDRRDAPDLVLAGTFAFDRLLVAAPAELRLYRSDRC